jgi:hypothetical protein
MGWMEIQIVMEARDPPSGLVAPARGEPVRFVGWLGLLKVLSDAIEVPDGERP